MQSFYFYQTWPGWVLSRSDSKLKEREHWRPGRHEYQPEVRCLAWYNASVTHNESDTIVQSTEREEVSASAGADPGLFLGGGALVSCSTSTPINHIVFFFENTSCIRKPQVISGWGGGGAHPLHPSPRSVPAWAGRLLWQLSHLLQNFPTTLMEREIRKLLSFAKCSIAS